MIFLISLQYSPYGAKLTVEPLYPKRFAACNEGLPEKTESRFLKISLAISVEETTKVGIEPPAARTWVAHAYSKAVEGFDGTMYQAGEG